MSDEPIFKNKLVLVTGSGRGIGRAIALSFASQGANLVINFFRQRSEAEETVSLIQGVVITDALKHFAVTKDISLMERLVTHTPAGRLVTPEDVAKLVAFLCTPSAYMIRGQIIIVDGGATLPFQNITDIEA